MERPAEITPYQARTTHNRNPLARFSHRARMRYALSLIASHLPAKGAMLDFGCAGGELLVEVRLRFPGADLYGLDPFASPGQGYVLLRNPGDCAGMTFDVIAAFEVLEHLDAPATGSFFDLCGNNLRPGGVCMVSVPNMLGPVLLPKLLHGLIASGSALNYSWSDAARASLLLRSPERLPPNRAGTMRHKGFDWRQTRARIAAEFEIVSESVTPLPHLWWGLNSQWFCLFRPTTESRSNRK